MVVCLVEGLSNLQKKGFEVNCLELQLGKLHWDQAREMKGLVETM